MKSQWVGKLALARIHVSLICYNQFNSKSKSPSCLARGIFNPTSLATCGTLPVEAETNS